MYKELFDHLESLELWRRFVAEVLAAQAPVLPEYQPPEKADPAAWIYASGQRAGYDLALARLRGRHA